MIEENLIEKNKNLKFYSGIYKVEEYIFRLKSICDIQLDHEIENLRSPDLVFENEYKKLQANVILNMYNDFKIWKEIRKDYKYRLF